MLRSLNEAKDLDSYEYNMLRKTLETSSTTNFNDFDKAYKSLKIEGKHLSPTISAHYLHKESAARQRFARSKERQSRSRERFSDSRSRSRSKFNNSRSRERSSTGKFQKRSQSQSKDRSQVKKDDNCQACKCDNCREKHKFVKAFSLL